jgi:hypothetical protein
MSAATPYAVCNINLKNDLSLINIIAVSHAFSGTPDFLLSNINIIEFIIRLYPNLNDFISSTNPQLTKNIIKYKNIYR